ncbi:MAG: tRNA lysidine(34) synthetase TilS [Rhodocyclaceae bacterium]|nr:tRNA lysidine(34) synthetase TilS [Rhodocyclaceae bacterium]
MSVVRAALAAHIPSGARVCVGLSGGVDSSVLLDCVARLQPELRYELGALHVHHGLSPHAGSWARHCQAQCDRLGLALAVHEVEVITRGEGVEAAARHARYAAFARSNADWLLLAHHADDQAETLLHNLLRGAGVKGAAAMPLTRALGAGCPTLLRPMLALRRADLEAYARGHGIDWIEDEANRNPRYARSALRHEILPAMERRWPAAVSTLARAAGLFAEADQLLQEIGAADLRACTCDGALDTAALSRLPAPRARNGLRVWLAGHGIPAPAAQRLDEFLRQSVTADMAQTMEWRCGDRLVFRYQGRLHCLALPAAVPARLAWRGESELDWAGTRIVMRPAQAVGICCQRLQGAQVEFRRRSGGERLRLHGHQHALKQLFQQYGIAPPLRALMPLLYCGDQLVWVPGIGIADDWRTGAAAAGLQPGWDVLHPSRDNALGAAPD